MKITQRGFGRTIRNIWTVVVFLGSLVTSLLLLVLLDWAHKYLSGRIPIWIELGVFAALIVFVAISARTGEDVAKLFPQDETK